MSISRSPAHLTVLAVLTSLLALESHLAAEEAIVFDFEGPPGEDGVPKPWEFRRWAPLTGLGDHVAQARVVEQEGRKVLYLKSADSGFLVGTERPVDVSRHRQVSWSWKAETLPAGGHFTQRSTNDQALQLLFGFEGGRVVGYIWDTTGPVGATGSGLSWREDVKVIVVRAGKEQAGRWWTEQRNLYEDFVKLFGEQPPRLKGVAIQSNSQHTESSGSGFVGSIRLTP